MLRFSHKTLIRLSGLIWFFGGVSLLRLGFHLVQGLINHPPQSAPLLHLFLPFTGDVEYASVGLIAIGLALGAIKGRTVFAKSVKRVVSRIQSFSEPTPLYKMYSLPYLFLLLSMVGISLLIKYTQVSVDIRATLDIAIGAALVNGSILYFRAS